MTDLVIQSRDLPTAAVDAFRVACPARRVVRHVNAARLYGVGDDGQTAKVVAALATYWHCDAALVRTARRAADFRALILDMDSTVITIECIDEVARLAGKGAQVSAITEAAMRGEIADYAESLRRRVALLAGTEESVLERVRTERMQLTSGAHALLAAARANGWGTLLVSGGFTAFTEPVRKSLGIDASCANALATCDGHLTGEVLGPPEDSGRIVDAAGKARALRRLCATLQCGTDQAIAVGDGANDLEMMAAAGFSVAYCPKPIVRERATYVLEHTGLDGLLNLLSDPW
jgi:phosphoserine phosphatase